MTWGEAAFAAVRAALDRHQLRRESAIPTLSVIAGARDAAISVWSSWLATIGREVVISNDPDISARIAAHRAVRAALDGVVAGAVGPGVTVASAGPERAALVAALERRLGQPLASMWLGTIGDDALGALHRAAPELPWPGVIVALDEAAPIEASLDALARMAADLPRLPIAIVLAPDKLHRARQTGGRAGILVREGTIALGDVDEGRARPDVRTVGTPLSALRVRARAAVQEALERPELEDRARSLAERLLFEALEADATTRGLFALNACLEVRFGPRAAEIDLLCTAVGIAVEIDGYHHFRDADAYRRDRRKDVLLQRDGLLVLRFLAGDVVEELGGVVATIRECVEERRPLEGGL